MKKIDNYIYHEQLAFLKATSDFRETESSIENYLDKSPEGMMHWRNAVGQVKSVPLKYLLSICLQREAKLTLTERSLNT